MHAIVEKEALLERRASSDKSEDLWEGLTLAQKFAASSLTQFGYELTFIREDNISSVAVLVCNENIATISKAGEINTAPSIRLRN
tara:strand:- start:352 stop:606 length:255 start_codon:yes stop_codon:yes gene_type:complete